MCGCCQRSSGRPRRPIGARTSRDGDARGDELPERLRTRDGRRAALREARRGLDAEREAEGDGEEAADDEPLVALDLDRERLSTASRVGVVGCGRAVAGWRRFCPMFCVRSG
jgi:hypothetical protein